MKILKTSFKDLKLIKSPCFKDKRGFFRELLRNSFFLNQNFKFWSVSNSNKNVVRGLHIQPKLQQAKIYDVVLDLRKKSKTYGKYHITILSEKNFTSLFVPKGFAHGFCGLEKENLVLYGMTNYRSKKDEVGIIWNDKTIKIKWPIKNPIVSKKDKNNITFQKFKNLY